MTHKQGNGTRFYELRTRTRWLILGTGLVVLAASALAPLGLSHEAVTPTYSVVYTFNGGTDGANPDAGVIADSSGNLYGVTPFGGASNNGIAFRIDTTGNETILYNFTGGSDGGTPSGGLIEDSAGNFYGTTALGGGLGYGVVYSLDSGGNETVLYTFTGGADGANPQAGVLRDGGGNLYGTTMAGGLDWGVVFKLDPAGNLTVLHTFAGSPSDGATPLAGLAHDSAGNFYGTTWMGGSFGQGTAFKVDTKRHESVLHNFTGAADGGFPFAPLLPDSAGDLYGTASEGLPVGAGLVFKLSPSGSETVLHAFLNKADGGFPVAGLVRDSAGNLYGAAGGGGSFAGICGPNDDGCGVVFELSTSGKESLLYTFTGGSDGARPASSLLVYRGSLYGTTERGGNTTGACGSNGCGVVFKVSPH